MLLVASSQSILTSILAALIPVFSSKFTMSPNPSPWPRRVFFLHLAVLNREIGIEDGQIEEKDSVDSFTEEDDIREEENRENHFRL